MTLSKSDFQLASDCPKKLVYKKAFYPTTNDTDEYMEMLAQGGYIIGHMATLYYPDGIYIEGDTASCLKQTEELLKRDNVVLFEAAIQSGQKIIRVDILEKKGRRMNLIEVKAKSFDSEEDRKATMKSLATYVEDVAYQNMVLSEAYPEVEISSYLMMPDKAKRTSIDGLAGWFSIQEPEEAGEEAENEEIITQQRPRFRKPEVVFKYEHDADRKQYLAELKRDGILGLLDVNKEVEALQNEIRRRSKVFLRILNKGIKAEDYALTKNCKHCEFRTTEEEEDKDGYGECWGSIGYEDPHIFDLYYGGSIGSAAKGFYLDELINEGKTSLWDINVERLKKANGEISTRGSRQLIQLEYTQREEEWKSQELKSLMKGFDYPHHYIDFETYTGAVPYHHGMRPYELIAFQWSCHTIEAPGAAPKHKEWLHTYEEGLTPETFPNFEFARSLMQHIGREGTPFMWATHENTVLRGILNQMEVFGYNNPTLEAWLRKMTKDKEEGREGRWVDMNQIALEHYFHPLMKGKTSIKKVLPAIWTSYPYLHEVPYFKDYAPEKLEEGLIDPYDALTKGIQGTEESDDAVSGGTDAMRAYQRIRFDDTVSKEQKREIQRQLLEYCKLDTMAMVIIGHHWAK